MTAKKLTARQRLERETERLLDEKREQDLQNAIAKYPQFAAAVKIEEVYITIQGQREKRWAIVHNNICISWITTKTPEELQADHTQYIRELYRVIQRIAPQLEATA